MPVPVPPFTMKVSSVCGATAYERPFTASGSTELGGPVGISPVGVKDNAGFTVSVTAKKRFGSVTLVPAGVAAFATSLAVTVNVCVVLPTGTFAPPLLHVSVVAVFITGAEGVQVMPFGGVPELIASVGPLPIPPVAVKIRLVAAGAPYVRPITAFGTGVRFFTVISGFCTVRLTDTVCVFAGTTTTAALLGSGIGVSVAEIISVSAPLVVRFALLVSAQLVIPETASTNGFPPAPDVSAHIASGAFPTVPETVVISTCGLVPAAVPYGRPTTPSGNEAGTPVNAYSVRTVRLLAVPLGALVPGGTTMLMEPSGNV